MITIRRKEMITRKGIMSQLKMKSVTMTEMKIQMMMTQTQKKFDTGDPCQP